MHTQLSTELTCPLPSSPPLPTNSARGVGAAVTLQKLKQREVIVLSPLKQNKLRSDTQHMSLDIKPYGRGAERAIYLKVVVVIGRKDVIGVLTEQARPLRERHESCLLSLTRPRQKAHTVLLCVST